MKKTLILIALFCSVLTVQSVYSQSFKSKLKVVVPESYSGQCPSVNHFEIYQNKKQNLANISDNKFKINLEEDWFVKYYDGSVSDNFEYLTSDFSAKGWTKITMPTPAQPSKKIVYFTKMYVSQYWDFRQMYLRVPMSDGIYDVFVNGSKVGTNLDSRNIATFDLTKYVVEGYNNLVIICKNDTNKSLLQDNPKMTGGLNGSVYLYSTPKLQIEDYRTSITYTNGYNVGNVQIYLDIRTNLLNRKEAKLLYELYDSEGNSIFKDERWTRLELKDTYTATFHSSVESPKLYSDLSPYTYYAVITLIHENRQTQSIKIPIRFDELSRIDNKFISHTSHKKLYGVVLEPIHQVLSDSLYSIKANKLLQTIKSLGFNAIMLNSNERDIFYTACDNIGLYVIDIANIDITKSGKSRGISGSLANVPATADAITQRVLNRYQKIKEHSSVIALRGSKSGSNGYSLYEAYMSLRDIDKNFVFASNATDLEWNNDFVIYFNPKAKTIKSLDNSRFNFAVTDNDKSFATALKAVDNDELTGFFVNYASLPKDCSNKIKAFDFEYAQGSYNTLIYQNRIDDTKLSINYKLYCNGELLHNDTKPYKKSFSIDNSVLNYKVDEYRKLNRLVKKEYKLKVSLMYGNTPIKTIETDYKQVKKK